MSNSTSNSTSTIESPIAAASSVARVAVGGQALGDAELQQLRSLINRQGLTAAALALGIPRSTTANAGAGAGLRTATRLLLVDRLRRLEAPSK